MNSPVAISMALLVAAEMPPFAVRETIVMREILGRVFCEHGRDVRGC